MEKQYKIKINNSNNISVNTLGGWRGLLIHDAILCMFVWKYNLLCSEELIL